MTEYLTLPQVAELLHCSVWQARRLLASGAIRATKPGRQWVTTRAAVEDFWQRTSEAPSSAAPRRRRRRSA